MNRAFNIVRGESAVFWLILALAVALRLWIAAYNTEANDSHLEVIQDIIATGEMPVVDDCWQCYHVKAFHYPAAVALARLSITNPIDQLHLLQYVNVSLGVLTVLLLWGWLRQRPIDEGWKLALFALLALNPRFASINAQVTNDSLVIFAATACFFCYARFLDRRQFVYLWLAVLFCGLSAAAKASGLVVAILLFGHLLLVAVMSYKRLPEFKRQIAVFALLTLAVFAVVPYSGYVQNAREAGSPLANNIEKYDFPNWSEELRWSQAGTINIVDSYLAFPWLALVEYPYITKGPAYYPEHRVNHWAQLYGRNAFVRFNRWPASWETNGTWTTRIGQAAMVLSLVPLALLLVGLASLTFDTIGRVVRSLSLRPVLRDPEIFLGMAAVAMFAMSLKLSIDFQTYRIMKAIYLYPALLGILALLVRGTLAVQRRATPNRSRLLRWPVVGLVFVHVADLAVLATDVQARYAGQVQELAAFERAPPLGPNQIRLNQLPRDQLATKTPGIQANRSYQGKYLTGGYRKYRTGYGTHAKSVLVFIIDEQYAHFETSMALADEAYSGDGVQFEIWGDSKLLYRSPRLIDHQVVHAKVDVSDTNALMLKVMPLGTSYGDLANWLRPVLTKKQEGARSNVDKLLD